MDDPFGLWKMIFFLELIRFLLADSEGSVWKVLHGLLP